MRTANTTLPRAAAPLFRHADRSVVALLRALVDPLVGAIGVLAATWLAGRDIRSAEIVLAIIVFSLAYPGTLPFRQRPEGLAVRILAGWAVVVGVLWAFGAVTGLAALFDQRVLVAWAAGTPAVQVLAHALAPWLLSHPRVLETPERAIVIGASDLGRSVARTLAAEAERRTQVVAFFDDRRWDRGDDGLEMPARARATEAPLCGRLENVPAFVKAHAIDRIYIALPMASQPRILKLLDDLRDTTASICFVPDVFLSDLIQARVDLVGGLPIVAVCESPFFGTAGLVKRTSDVILASLAVLLCLPLLLATALAIRLESPGPVIFRQRRYGLDGREIVVWKFRSMRVTEDSGPIRQATADDPRVTRVGRFIRRTSIDELPQFFNVLQGRMSVVGPRPHAVAHNEMYRSLIKGYMVRHKVRPGLTGWAQVNGARGETRSVDDMKRRIDLDLEYLRRWSLGLDLRIVMRTILLVIRGDSRAY